MDGSTVDRFVGMSAASAYAQLLLADPRAQRMFVFKYISPPSLQQRVKITQDEQLLIDQALALRKSTHLPFWNALFTAFLVGKKHTSQLIGAAFFHNGPGEATSYDRSAIEAGVLDELVITGSANLGLSSMVHDVDEQVWHLPMIDFHCEVSLENEGLAAIICEHLMPDGYLLIDSGDSYHACGFKFLAPDERVHMLGKALLAAPVVDGQYIAHQLQQIASSIRISKGGKASRGPVVVRAWEGRKGVSENA